MRPRHFVRWEKAPGGDGACHHDEPEDKTPFGANLAPGFCRYCFSSCCSASLFLYCAVIVESFVLVTSYLLLLLHLRFDILSFNRFTHKAF